MLAIERSTPATSVLTCYYYLLLRLLPQAEKVRAIEAEHPGDFSKIGDLVKGELYRKSFQECEEGATTRARK